MRTPIVFALVATGVGGCHSGRTGDGRLLTYQDVTPDVFRAHSAKLVFAGTQVPVGVQRVERDGTVSLRFWAHGEKFQEEVYRVSHESFGLLSANGEAYHPALDLLRFPVTPGETWTWHGTVMYGILRKCSATVKTSIESARDGSGSAAPIKVVVHRTFDGAEPAPVDLTFWIVPKEGVVQRSFGGADRREEAN